MKILVSACLLGENCKYNGGNNYDPTGERPEMPEGMEGDRRRGEMEEGKRPDRGNSQMNIEEAMTEFVIKDGGNMFMVMSVSK